MRLARAEHDPDVMVRGALAPTFEQVVDQAGAAVARHDHDPLPHGQHARWQLIEERREAVFVDLASGEAVGAPAEPGCPHHFVSVAGEEDPGPLVLDFDEASADVIGGLLIATHLLDVDRIAKPVDRLLLVFGLGPGDDEYHAQMLPAAI